MTDFETTPDNRSDLQVNNNDRRGRIVTGVFFLIVGVVALARSFMVPIPEWLFNWQTLLITIGIFIGIRGNFQGASWLILILVGGAFLLNDFYFSGDLHKHTWPVIIISLGVIFVIRAGRERSQRRSIREINSTSHNQDEDKADITTLFGSAIKNMKTQNFSGGDITSICGGTHLSLLDSNIKGKVHLDITAIFGGVELIIPSDWTIQSDVVCILGAVKDNRIQSAIVPHDPEKILVLDGTAILAGIEIKSFKK